MTVEHSSATIRVLLVEDSRNDQIAFQRALHRSSTPFVVTVCERAEKLAAAMQNGSRAFDMVVMDHNLPGISGLDIYTTLRQQTDLPPFVMLTGAGSEKLAVEALTAGLADYIIKDPAQGYLNLLPLKLKAVKQRHTDRLGRHEAQAALKKALAGLESTVASRTADLARTIEALEKENAQRRATEKALRRSQKAQRNLSKKIVDSQENERRQMAKELHDSIGSSLAAIKFALEGKLDSMQDSPPTDTISLERIIDHLHATIHEVRRISSFLRPSMLDELGLLATIKWFCRNRSDMYRRVSIDTRLTIDEKDIPEINKIVIYRIMQEALNNALKHSGCTIVRVHLAKADGRIRLRVTDNGCGFDPENATGSQDQMTGFGLQGMRDRVEVAGGSIVFDSQPNRGTTLYLEIPDRD